MKLLHLPSVLVEIKQNLDLSILLVGLFIIIPLSTDHPEQKHSST